MCVYDVCVYDVCVYILHFVLSVRRSVEVRRGAADSADNFSRSHLHLLPRPEGLVFSDSTRGAACSGIPADVRDGDTSPPSV